MKLNTRRTQIAIAVGAAVAAIGMAAAPITAAAKKTAGTYVAGDFHNHTTCSDGSISMQKLVKKATDKVDTPWGLDWFVQAGHGGSGNRNCTLVEDATLDTPAYPFVSGKGPTTTWANSIGAANVKGNVGLNSSGVANNTKLSTQSNPNMWRWQSVQEFQYPLIEYLNAYKGLPLFLGLESVVAGHEHASMSIITGQIPASLDGAVLPTSPPYPPVALGNASAFAQWSYCFDRGDADNSQGGGQNWDCSVPGSLNSADPSWNVSAQKLFPIAPEVGSKGHDKTVEAIRWMKAYHPTASYYVPAHLERAGPFNPNGNNGYNIEHLRNFNNAGPNIAFGFETQPGHGASDARGEYTIRRNSFGSARVDTVGGTTFGGTGVYGAQIGGVWDALLGEGRNWWFFASSDWHNRGSFGADDRRSTQDFFPGEYQRNYTMVRRGTDKLRPQTIVDGLRSGNNFAASGQLIDRLAFIACASYPGLAARSNASVESLAVSAATNNTDIDVSGCATMGEKLKLRPGAEIVVSIVVRDPAGSNYSPYSFPNPSLLQVGINQPLNMPVLDHVDVIRGLVTGYKTPGAADYSGEWPRDWIEPYRTGSGTPSLASVPDAAKNLSAAVIKTFGSGTWTTVSGNAEFKKMTFRIPAVTQSQYVRLRGSNLPAGVPFETDADGNPLPDLWTNATSVNAVSTSQGTEFASNFFLRIPCTTTGGTTQFDQCPSHLPSVTNRSGLANFPNGYTGKMVAFDVAAWADLWFYSNPIYLEVDGSTVVAGVK